MSETNTKEKFYTVYMHINKSNQKKYIGITSQNVKKRWQNGYGYKTNPYFWRSIQKYGWNGFEHSIIESGLTEQEAKAKEIELIGTYNTIYPNGYNYTQGGDNVSEKLHSQETKQKISQALKGRHLSEECRQKISEALSGEKNPFYGKTWTDEHRQKVKENRVYKPHSEETKQKMSKSRTGENSKCAIRVYQYSEEGFFIQEWCSATEAGRQLRLNQSNICEVCKGNRNECGGFIWRYYKADKIPSIQKKSTKQVAQKLNGELLKIYKSASAAGKELKLDPSGISKCCRGEYSTCGGFTFEYC